jgi:hypothetical protein
MTPYWLEIAAEQARAAESYHQHVLHESSNQDNGPMGIAMESECKASMQSIAAAGIALDAFYAVVKEHIQIPEAMSMRWRTNRTARFRQIAEVYRQAFRVSSRSAVRMRQAMKQVFDFRDRAVHPPAVARQPVLYEELSVGTEWRFVAFRALNARVATATALSIVAQLLGRPRPELASLSEYCGPAIERIQPLVDGWEHDYGQLYQRGV